MRSSNINSRWLQDVQFNITLTLCFIEQGLKMSYKLANVRKIFKKSLGGGREREGGGGGDEKNCNTLLTLIIRLKTWNGGGVGGCEV